MSIPQYNPSLVVLAGRSGSGKTAVLRHLAQQGYPVIDLENLAQHSGSAFGHLPFAAPETSMGFLKSLKKQLDDYKYEPLVFTECKGNALGNAVLPETFITKLRNGFIMYLDVPFEERLQHLTQSYQPVAPEDFIKAAQKLEGKIEANKLRLIQTFLKAHDYKAAIALLLDYYDVSDAYNYFIQHAHCTLHFQQLDVAQMVATLTEALMEQHPLLLNCD